MGVTSHTRELKSPIAPTRIFKSLFLDHNNLFPKILPNVVKSVDMVGGNGGVGTISTMTFADGKFIKTQMDILDQENMVTKYTVFVEGDDPMAGKIESISFETKVEASSEGGSILKTTTEIHSVGEAINIEEIKDRFEGMHALRKIVEDYLSQNPDAYA